MTLTSRTYHLSQTEQELYYPAKYVTFAPVGPTDNLSLIASVFDSTGTLLRKVLTNCSPGQLPGSIFYVMHPKEERRVHE